MSKLKTKTKTNGLQKCRASYKRSHTLVTCITDGLSKGYINSLTESLWAYWMQRVFQVNEHRSPTCCPVFPHQPPPLILLDQIYGWCRLSMFQLQKFSICLWWFSFLHLQSYNFKQPGSVFFELIVLLKSTSLQETSVMQSQVKNL